MRHRLRLALVVAVIAAPLVAGGARGADVPNPVSVTVDRTEISTQLGHKFAFRSIVTNAGSTAVRGLIAHLNVLSLRNGVYVDPEDWSSHRTRYLPPIEAGGSETISWGMEAVNSGSFAVYVAVLPETGGAEAPATGAAIHVAVARRRTLNSGGILPLALGIPALLGLLTLGFRLRRGGFHTMTP